MLRSKLSWKIKLLFAAFMSCVVPTALAAEPIVIGFDSEVGHQQSTSDDAIRLGIGAAIAEINAGGGVLGRPLAIRELDNRSLPARGVENMHALAADPNVVAVFGGKYSPVVLETLPVAEMLGMPLLVPWSAADAITRHGRTPNFAFRIGLTDSIAVERLLDGAHRAGKRNVAILMPRNAWGRSCLEATESIVTRKYRDMKIVSRQWHNRGDTDFKDQLKDAVRAGADVILGILNEAEGAGVVRAAAAMDPSTRLPIFSHWGITGGDFPSIAGSDLNEVELAVVVTAIPSAISSPRLHNLLNKAASAMQLSSGNRFTSAVGFMHAYDLTHLLALAIRAAGNTDRGNVRQQLEGPLNFSGLLKTYRAPFRNPQHETLSAKDLKLASFDRNGVLIPYRPRTARQASAG